jgi:nitrate/nitrite transport system substrate-binding protein
MRFYNGGKVNFPHRGHALWFMAQYVRFGYLKELPLNYQAIADKLILSDLYREVAMDMGIPVPDDDMTPFTVTLDKATFDPADPVAYLKTHGGQ